MKTIKNLIFIDFAERFSFISFLTCITYFLTLNLKKDEIATAQTISLFKMIYFFFPLVSSILITIFDKISIKFAIFVIIFYLFGHIALILNKDHFLLFIAIIAIGAGMLKPLIISIGSMQFSKNEEQKKTIFFNYIYLMMNLGGFFSYLLMPIIVKKSIEKAFIISFLSLLIAFIVFLIPIKKYKNSHQDSIIQDKIKIGKILNLEKILNFIKNLPNIGLFYVFLILIPYCSLYDQILTQMPIQGFRMANEIFNFKIEPFHLQSLEPILIILSVPILLKKIKDFSIYKKFLIGFILFFIGCVYHFSIEYRLMSEKIHLMNQIFVICLLVFSEIFLYPTFVQVTFGAKNKMYSIFGSLIFTIRAMCNLFNFYIFKLFNEHILLHKVFIIIVAFGIILILLFKKEKFKMMNA